MESRKGNAFDEMQSHREQSASIEVSFRALRSLLVKTWCRSWSLASEFRTQAYNINLSKLSSPRDDRGHIQVFDIIIRGYIIF